MTHRKTIGLLALSGLFAIALPLLAADTVGATSRTLTIDSGSHAAAYTMTATPPTITSKPSAGSGTKTYSSSTPSVCTINASSGVVAFIAVGTCTIGASIATDGTYAAADASAISFMIKAKSVPEKKVATAEQVACIGTAVNARETALGTAMAAYGAAVNTAYSSRATALKQAYTLAPGDDTIKLAVKGAWSAFKDSSKAARKAWQTSRNSAWSDFRKAANLCKAPLVPSDNAMSVGEAQGM